MPTSLPVDAIAAADFRYCPEHGVTRHFSEMENYDLERKQRTYGRTVARLQRHVFLGVGQLAV